MKTLVLVAHPNLAQSVVNKAWVERLRKEEGITVHDLYEAYPDGRIDAAREQRLAEQHDRIVFQFPLYWYSTPALLKEWQDVVLAYGWAFGSEGTKLKGKHFLLAFSAGGPHSAYQPEGANRYTIDELTKPLRATANLTGMVWQEPFTTHGVRGLTPEQVAESAEELVRRLQA